MAYKGQSLEKDLNEIKKLYLQGQSTISLTKKFVPGAQRSSTTLESAIQSMKDGTAPVKITKTELARRPKIIGKNQQGLSKQEQILNTPELRKEFIEYANSPGVTIKDIRKKYGIKSLYPEKRGPEKKTLRDLITKEVQLGRQDVNPSVTKNMERLQNYLSRVEIPEGRLQSGKPEYEKLIKKSGFSKNDFNRVITQLQLYYANPGEKRNLEIIPEVKKIINKFPSPRYNREILRSLGYSKKTTDVLDNVEKAAQQVTEAGTVLEHALPKAFIKELRLPKKYYLFGERTTNFLNQFKTQFDNQMLTAAKNFSLIEDPTRQDYLDYKDEINKIRNTVAKKTGGYEIGYVDFVDGKPVPVTSQKSILEGEGDFGPRTTGIKNYFKNAYYHNRLYENFKKNPNDPDFGTLRVEVKKNKFPFVKEIEAEKNYNLIKDLKTPEEFVDIYQKNPNNLFIKSLGTATGRKSNLGSYLSSLSRFGKPAAAGAGLLTAMTAALSAKETPSPIQDTQTAMQDQVVEGQVPEQKLASPIKYDQYAGFVTPEDQNQKASQSDLLYWIADNEIPEEIQQVGKMVGEAAAVIGGATVGLGLPDAKKTIEEARIAGKSPVKGVLGKGFYRLGSPLATAAFTIPQVLDEDTTFKDIGTDPLNYLGLATMETLGKRAGTVAAPAAAQATGIMGALKNYGTLKNVGEAIPGKLSTALRLGLSPRVLAGASRFLGIPGLIASTGYSLYDYLSNKDKEAQ
jgi:hypothetical protein